MSGSTTRLTVRSQVLRLSAVGLLLLAVGCGNHLKDEFRISAKEDRGSSGMLEGLTVDGKGYSPNSTVLVTLLMSGTGGNAGPYVEEQIQTDSRGKFKYEKKPVPCPQPVDYQSGSYTLVVARDQQSGISGSAQLHPGREPDCRGTS